MVSVRSIVAVVAAACIVACANSQQYSQRGNYVDEGNFDYAEPAPPQRAAPRPVQSFSRPSSSLAASAGPKPTPVPILKQINRHNEDGSYTYGYEGADGAFKIETKLPSGEVMGKYGYVDDLGKVRVVEYGANKYGFQPAGEGITVAPPTLVDETQTKRNPQSNEPVYDDGSYYEEQPAPVRAPAPRPAPRPASRPAPRPAPQQPQYSQDFPSFQSSQSFSAPQRPSSPSLGPVPPRAAVAGAAPVGQSFSQPRPQPAPQRPPSRPAPQSFFQPAPSPAPVYESRPAPSFPQQQPSRSSYGRSGGILDQLERDFALPSNSAPALHDITFGSY